MYLKYMTQFNLNKALLSMMQYLKLIPVEQLSHHILLQNPLFIHHPFHLNHFLSL